MPALPGWLCPRPACGGCKGSDTVGKKSPHLMKKQNFRLGAIALLLLTACDRRDETPLFAGRVESFYYAGPNEAVSGFTRFEKGLPGTSTRVKEDVFVEVRQNWVRVKLLNRKDESYLVPRERVRSILVGTEQGNALNIPQ